MSDMDIISLPKTKSYQKQWNRRKDKSGIDFCPNAKKRFATILGICQDLFRMKCSQVTHRPRQRAQYGTKKLKPI